MKTLGQGSVPGISTCPPPACLCLAIPTGSHWSARWCLAVIGGFRQGRRVFEFRIFLLTSCLVSLPVPGRYGPRRRSFPRSRAPSVSMDKRSPLGECSIGEKTFGCQRKKQTRQALTTPKGCCFPADNKKPKASRPRVL